MTQFNVNVIGSLRNGYTATAEKVIANSASHVLKAPISALVPVSLSAPLSVSAPEQSLIKNLTNEEKQKQNALQELQRIKVIASVKVAADTAETAVSEILHLWGAAGRGKQINGNAFDAAENAMAAAKVAVNAARVVVNALNAGIVNNEAKGTVNYALTTSKDAEMKVKNAVKEIKKMKEGNIPTHSLQSVVIDAKKAVEKAREYWVDLHERMSGVLHGGRTHTQRKRKHQKRKHQKRYTAHK